MSSARYLVRAGQQGVTPRFARQSHSRYLATVALVAALAAPVHAQLSGTLRAQMILSAGCIISGGTAATTGLDFGLLDFGTQPAPFTGVVTAVPTLGAGVAGNTQILCSSGVSSVRITVSGGSNAGQGSSVGTGSRAMANGTSYIPYEIYADAGHSIPYVAGTQSAPITIPTPGTAFPLPIFGRVNKTNPLAPSAGTYSDTVTVTLAF